MNNLEQLINFYNNQQPVFGIHSQIYKSSVRDCYEFQSDFEDVNEEIIKERLKEMLFQNSNLFVNYANSYFSNRFIDLVDEKTNFKYSDEIETSPINANKILTICHENNIKIFEDIIKVLIEERS